MSTVIPSSVLAPPGQITPSAVTIDQPESSWLGLLGRLVLFVLQVLTTILYWALKLTTISTPTLLFNIFSTTLTVSMNATTLLLIIAAFVAVVSWIVRYRYLNMYSRLPPQPQRREPLVEIPPDSNGAQGVKPGLNNYLDEFISAIKLFGYLERPVFHELTRSMQTRKLISGETWNLEDEKGFCILVDGQAEIFVKSSRAHRGYGTNSIHANLDSSHSEDDNSESTMQKYQLLTEVGNGVAMSSLFSVMSLFTEDISLRHPDDESPSATDGVGRPPFTAHPDFMRSEDRLTSPSFHQGDTPEPSTAIVSLQNKKVPTFFLDNSIPQHPSRPTMKRTATSVHPDLIARATVDSTIAIIPASAFRRLIKVFPKATAHIVQVILSRFQRVTLATAYNYLGLSSEVLQLEMDMINSTMFQLPNFLRGDALDRLKEKFGREIERIGVGEGDKGIALHNAAVHRESGISASLRRESMVEVLARQRHKSVVTSIISGRGRSSIDSPSPGDLLANVQVPRSSTARSPGPGSYVVSQGSTAQEFGRDDGNESLPPRSYSPMATANSGRPSLNSLGTADEDNTFRTCILECMFKAIGLSNGSSRDIESKETSPRLNPFDSRRGRSSLVNNAFGFMGPLDMTGDGDSESITSAGVPVNAALNEQILANEMKGEVEIIFYPKGSTLIKQGERSPGLYYVIDGFLDVCVPGKGNATRDFFSPFHHGGMGSDPSHQTHLFDKNSTDDGKPKSNTERTSVGLIKPGGLSGYIGTLSSYRSFMSIVAKTDVYVGFLPRASLERFVEKYPIVLLTMAKRLTNLLPRLISHIDFALEWVQVDAGEVIYHQGDESDAIYLVLNGRLRLVADGKNGNISVKAEFGQGDSIGELEVLTESVRPGTLHAIRDTELVKFPRSLFNSLAEEHPNITIKISKIIAARMSALVDGALKPGGDENGGNKGTSTLNLRTVAILPVTSGVPVVEFSSRLMSALAQVGPPNGATSLNHAAILNHLGKHAFNRMGKLKLSQYLADLEEKYGLVVYVAGKSLFMQSSTRL